MTGKYLGILVWQTHDGSSRPRRRPEAARFQDYTGMDDHRLFLVMVAASNRNKVLGCPPLGRSPVVYGRRARNNVNVTCSGTYLCAVEVMSRASRITLVSVARGRLADSSERRRGSSGRRPRPAPPAAFRACARHPPSSGEPPLASTDISGRLTPPVPISHAHLHACHLCVTLASVPMPCLGALPTSIT